MMLWSTQKMGRCSIICNNMTDEMEFDNKGAQHRILLYFVDGTPRPTK